MQNTCDATLPDLEQAVADADNALANAVASGLSRYLLVDYEKAIDTAKVCGRSAAWHGCAGALRCGMGVRALCGVA